MSFNSDEDILQDFLVEAGEILELLFEQLVDLENSVDDYDLLNAIFRGFHTIKGGAGFLQLEPLVEICHISENVFDELRNNRLSVTPELMDVVLQATDILKEMFDVVTSREYPDPAPQEILQNLHQLVHKPTGNEEKPLAEEKPSVQTSVERDTSRELFEEPSLPSAEPATDANDEITEDEFDALLDQLHGPGGKVSQSNSDAATQTPSEVTRDSSNAQNAIENILSSSDELITDEEFESLLDALNGGTNGGTEPKKPEEKAKEKSKAEVVADQVAESVLKYNEKSTVDALSVRPAEKSSITKPASGKSTAKAASKVATRGSKEAPQGETTVRVDTSRLDDIMNMVGELVLVRNRLVRLGLRTSDEAMSKAVANLDVVTADLQASVMKTRMQPIKKVFGRFPRVVRDLARSLKKEVNLVLKGEETDLDKNLVEALADPLVHLVRNAVDHGVEQPDVRVKSGKAAAGTVILSAEQEGDHIMLTIQDDGAGMNADILRKKAEEKGLMDRDAAERLSDNEAFHLIFHPGFSTKEEVSDISGRGVGMDVVKTKITQLNGSINVSSEPNKGTLLSIKVPLTLAIMPTLMVMLGEQTFAFPLVSVNEIFHLDLTATNEVDGQEVVIVREKPIPLFRLTEWLVSKPNHAFQSSHDLTHEEAHVVIVSVGNQKVGFVVDQLIGQEEVVIKPLGKMLHGTAGMAGATITGDGRIALILDVPNMLSEYASRSDSSGEMWRLAS